jgi:hypothetical protein
MIRKNRHIILILSLLGVSIASVIFKKFNIAKILFVAATIPFVIQTTKNSRLRSGECSKTKIFLMFIFLEVGYILLRGFIPDQWLLHTKFNNLFLRYVYYVFTIPFVTSNIQFKNHEK